MSEEKKELTAEDKGAHGTVEVVQVADENAPGGFVEINKSDFDADQKDEKKFKLYTAPKKKAADEEFEAEDPKKSKKK